MGKNFLVAAFIVLVAASVYVYRSRDTRDLRETLGHGEEERQPRLAFENVAAYQYTGARVTSVLTARSAQLLEPNVLELTGHVVATKRGPDGDESLSAESVQAFFVAKGVMQIMKDSTIDKAEFTHDVEVKTGRYQMTTQYAEYLRARDLLRSTMPIDVTASQQSLHGDRGFQYFVGKQALVIKGPISGVVKTLEGT